MLEPAPNYAQFFTDIAVVLTTTRLNSRDRASNNQKALHAFHCRAVCLRVTARDEGIFFLCISIVNCVRVVCIRLRHRPRSMAFREQYARFLLVVCVLSLRLAFSSATRLAPAASSLVASHNNQVCGSRVRLTQYRSLGEKSADFLLWSRSAQPSTVSNNRNPVHHENVSRPFDRHLSSVSALHFSLFRVHGIVCFHLLVASDNFLLFVAFLMRQRPVVD